MSNLVHGGRHPLAKAGLLMAMAAMVACGGGGEETMSDAPAAAPAPAPAAMAMSPADITPEMVALGDSIFHGQVAGGLCLTCHAPDGHGLPGLAPDLTDTTWINVDGSLGAIVNLVQTGVPTPKEHPAPMLPMGGAQLTPDQIRAVAAYVYRLSNPM